MKRVFQIAFACFFCAAPAAAFTLSGFDTPESIAVDPDDGAYYVSNLNGGPTDRDGNGYISKISANGNLVIQKFIGAKPEEALLDAPKGMAVSGGILYAADIDALKGFDKETGKPRVVVQLAGHGAKFLNDVAVDRRGVLYVTDTLANRIYRVDPHQEHAVSVFREGDDLEGPNGILLNPKTGHVMVACFRSGKLVEIDKSGGLHVLKKGLSQLDGLAMDEKGTLYLSSFDKGEIYRIGYYGRGTLTTFQSGLTTPADIAYDRRQESLLVPSFQGHTVAALPRLKKPASTQKE